MTNYAGRGRTNKAKVDPTTGLRLLHGNGCGKWTNCFSCKRNPNKCAYGNGNGKGKR